ncbi:MAG: DUF2834 domain-containing protein [Pseudomonadota bacterium]
MKNIYLFWAVAGTVLPVLCFLGVFHSETPSLLGFFPSIFVNGWAAGFAVDLFISSAVFWGYMFSASDGPRPTLYIILNLCVGLSLALPLYLYHVTRRSEAAVTAS